MKKVMFISSMGGHLNELLMLKPLFKKYDYHIVTEKTKATEYLKKDYNKKVSFLVYGTKKLLLLYPFILLINSILSLVLFIKYRPKYVITTGTHTAGPMCCIAKLFGSKIIYIETFASINKGSQTGKLIYKFADFFVVQWQSMLKVYPKATYGGWIF